MKTISFFKKISIGLGAVLICLVLFSIPKFVSAQDERAHIGTMSTFLTGLTTSNNTPNISDTSHPYASISSLLLSRNIDRAAIIREVEPLHREIYSLIEKAEGYRYVVENNSGEIETDDDGRAQTTGAASKYEIFKRVDGWNLNEDTENLKNLGLYAENQKLLFTRLLELSKKYGDHAFAEDSGGGTYQLFGMTEAYMQGVLDRSSYISRAVSSGLVIDADTGKPTDADENLLSGRDTGSIEIDNNQGFGGADTDSEGPGGEGNSPIQCSLANFDPQGCIALGLYYGLLKPSSWVLWASGVAFNYSLDFTLNFGKFIRDQGLGTSGSGAIYLGWSAIRDFINVGFIFILLYAGIATIVGIDGYGVKQTIVKVVIAALLLNFSLFFTKALIDMSNLIALQFYTRVLSAADQANYGAGFVGPKQEDSWDKGLSIGFVNALGLKSIWVSKDNQSGNQAGSAFGSINAGQLIIICLGGSAFILVTAFTLFMATLRFLYRSIVLIFLMILSPIGFVGGAIPALKGAASKWQSRLKNNLVFAPAYMAIFYVVAIIVFGKNIGPSQVGANSGEGLTGFGALFQGHVSSTGLLFWFIMIIGLMLGTQLAADSFADKMDMADAFKKKAKGWATGAAAIAPRRIFGGTADALIKNTAVKAVLARVPGGGVAMAGLDKVRSSKMFGTTSFKDKMKEDQKKTEGRAKLFKETRELTQYKGEDKADFDKREDAVKRRATNATSAYLGMGGPLGLVGKGEVKKSDLEESGKTSRLVQATRYIPIIGSSLEKMRRKNQAARKTTFEADREYKDKALKKELEAKIEETSNRLDIYKSSTAYKNEGDKLQTRVDRARATLAAADTIANVNNLTKEIGALEKHLKTTKDLEKLIRDFKDKISQIDSRKKDSK